VIDSSALGDCMGVERERRWLSQRTVQPTLLHVESWNTPMRNARYNRGGHDLERCRCKIERCAQRSCSVVCAVLVRELRVALAHRAESGRCWLH